MKVWKWMLAGLCVLCLAGCGKSKEVKEEQLALRSQGMQQALEGDYEGAIVSYEKALQLADLHAGALELDIAAYKASAQYHAGELQKAIDTCSAILDLKKSVQIHMMRGMLYQEAENAQAAKEDFAAALALTSKKIPSCWEDFLIIWKIIPMRRLIWRVPPRQETMKRYTGKQSCTGRWGIPIMP